MVRVKNSKEMSTVKYFGNVKYNWLSEREAVNI